MQNFPLSLEDDPSVSEVLDAFSEQYSPLAIAQVACRVLQCARMCAEDDALVAALSPALMVCFVPVTPPKSFTGQLLDLPVEDCVEAGQRMFRSLRAAHEAADAALAKKGRVMFVCQAGQSRSGTASVSYVMLRAGLGMESALAHVRSKKPNTDPNDGFRQLLRSLAARAADEAVQTDPLRLYAEPISIQPPRDDDISARLAVITGLPLAMCQAAMRDSRGNYNRALDALLARE
jgi:hypothetical protein